ncbi:patatin-like phospholipase family protein [Sungkyunkwania multivorans]|uniref:Patatin-like phospholipase family protein n=1 Tax=Sungkyunkwania multivorans TaxID=1173618 RepID=A0ABW3D0S6_9FLAO
MSTKKFKLCITMAGAVSAGAYTAGVLDYMLETLDLWEKAKSENRDIGIGNPGYDPSIPMHDVEIDVISGASAGGITGTLTLLNLLDENYEPVNQHNPEGNNNRFYKSWVEMADDKDGMTLKKMLQLDDIKKREKPESLLNTKAIEAIANSSLDVNENATYPPYVSKSLDLILTISNLRGINFMIDFDGSDEKGDSGTVITSHGGFFRYKIANEKFKRGMPEEEDALYHVMDLKNLEDVVALRDATLSTAAFPIGLKSRELKIFRTYLERYPKYLFGEERLNAISPILSEDDIYHFNSIDGGLINNEPYGIALKVLKEKNPEIEEENSESHAIVMVDPFPNQDHSAGPYEAKRDMISIAKGMFKALRNQVMFNQDGILDALSLSDRTKFLIAPTRKEKVDGKWQRAKNDLASAPLSGFAGFLDRSFREHDFHLGRQNCQSFLRYYFAVKNENIASRLGVEASEEAKARFCFAVPPKKEDGERFFPIIPDMRVIEAFHGTYDTTTYGPDAALDYPKYPSFASENFEKAYKKLIKKRVSSIVKGLSGSGMLTFGFNLLFKNKSYKAIKKAIDGEMKDAGLS